MKTRLALLAAASLPAAGVVAFVLPGSRLPKSSSITTTTTTTTTATTPRLAPLYVKADWFDRMPNAPEGADDGSMDDGMSSAQRHTQEKKKERDLAVAGDELRVAVRDAIWELDDRIHGLLPYDEADAEADPMYFLNALQHTLEGFGSDTKATTDASGRVLPPRGSSSSSSSSSKHENDISAMINKEIAMISSSTQDVFSKAQSSAAAMQASLVAAVEEGVKQANSASATLSAATSDAPQQIKEAAAEAAAGFVPATTMASSSVAERPAAAAAVKKEAAPAVASTPAAAVAPAAAVEPRAPVKQEEEKNIATSRFREEASSRPSVKKVRSQRWVEERLPRRQLQQQPAATIVRPPTIPAPATATSSTIKTTPTTAAAPAPATVAAGGGGGKPPRQRRDEEREEEQRRRKKAEAARVQAQLQLQQQKQEMHPPAVKTMFVAASAAAVKAVAAAAVVEERKKVVVPATPAPAVVAAAKPVVAAAAAPVVEEEPVLQVKTPAMQPEAAAKVIEDLSAPKTIKRMTTGADRARGVMVVDDDILSVSSPTGATTVQEAMKQAQAQAKAKSSSSSIPKAVITTAEELLVVPPPTASTAATTAPITVAASVPPSPTLKGAADEDLNPMPHVDRKSVEHILRDSKMAAVEEWHRTRSTENKDMSLEEKVLLVESRLVDEIRGGPSEAILTYVNVLEKIGEHQTAPNDNDNAVGAVMSAGNWDLAYSSAPVSPFLSLPRLLARFLVGVSAKVEGGGGMGTGATVVVYRAIFKFFDWFPRLKRTQRAVVSVVAPRKTVEVMSGRPRFTLGTLFSFVLPRVRLPSFGGSKKKNSGAAAVPVEDPKLTNTCTYLGAHLKICRLTRTPGVSAEPLLAVFLRGKTAGAKVVGEKGKGQGGEEEMMGEEEEELLMFGQGGMGGGGWGHRNSGRSKAFDRYGKRPGMA